jgi:chromosome segregation ATPase
VKGQTQAKVTSPAITAAAQHLANAEIQAQTATDSHTAAENEVAAIRARHAEMEAQRRAIVERRAAGDQRSDDGATLALLSADIEGLSEILARREADAAATRAAAQTAVRSLQAARANLDRTESQLAEQQLVAHADALADSLERTVAALRDIRSKLGGGRLGWMPKRSLADELRILDLGRAW